MTIALKTKSTWYAFLCVYVAVCVNEISDTDDDDYDDEKRMKNCFDCMSNSS